MTAFQYMIARFYEARSIHALRKYWKLRKKAEKYFGKVGK